MILSSDKSSEPNLSCFFDIIKPRRIEHLLKEEPFSSDPYFSTLVVLINVSTRVFIQKKIPAKIALLRTTCLLIFDENSIQHEFT